MRKARAVISKGLAVRRDGERVWHPWTKAFLSPDWDGIDFSEAGVVRLLASRERESTRAVRAEAELCIVQAQLAELGQLPAVPMRRPRANSVDLDSEACSDDVRQEWARIQQELEPCVETWDSISQVNQDPGGDQQAQAQPQPSNRHPSRQQ